MFREIPRPPQTYFEITAAAAKLIVQTEAASRADRSATLKAQRLARDAAAPVARGVKPSR
ncbi:hypothetical protein AP071_07380 [Rhodobacter capsulatus]|nr:hypothetical protein AP071_07380 [Rhodobacter capsulatus]KQB12715.1 hypothetical protein AP073_06345 [Rhodobacter capsulatus]